MEKPIAYSTDMVLATLDGRKIQTRRTKGLENIATWVDNFGFSAFTPEGHISGRGNTSAHGPAEKFYKMPYQKHDLLWVREEHLITFSDDKCWITVEFKDGYKFSVYYKEISLKLLERLHKRKTIGKWQRARFLPKEFARLWLNVTNVRVERLQDITEDDAIAEGIEIIKPYPFVHRYKDYLFGTKKDWHMQTGGILENPINSFQSLWISINGYESFNNNPWVLVIEFKVVSTTGRNNVKEVEA